MIAYPVKEMRNMEIYLEVIGQALFVFPFAALLITLPYVIYNYRKYGSVLSLRILIVYSFVLYMMCVYFLVILPLPSVDAVRAMTGPSMQLIPFQFAADIVKDPKAVFQVAFNVLMTVPFGLYLRYYFRCSFKKTVILSFLLSLFFELTQLSGLYFIYPRSYRLFDVDDLMANTLGGALGYVLLFPVKKLLPSRARIDENSFERGRKISVSRRLIAFLADMICLNILQGCLGFFSGVFHLDSLMERMENMIALPADAVCFSKLLSWGILLFYFAGISALWHGQTPGMRFMKIRLVPTRGGEMRWYQPLLRYGILFFIFVGIPGLWNGFVIYARESQWIDAALASVWQAILWGLYIAGFLMAVIWVLMGKMLFYEVWSGTKLASTIGREKENNP